MFVELLVNWVVAVLGSLGLLGVFFLMALESMVFPVPSELVMPFAGFLVAQGRLEFWPVVLAAAFGNLVGAWLSYFIGLHGGRPFLKTYGKFFLLNDHHLRWTENFFHKWGDASIFVSRFIPVVRHLISIPAGMGRMKLLPFSVFTFLGSFGWDAFLTWLGLQLGANWTAVSGVTQYLDLAVLAVFVLVALWFFAKRNESR